MTYPDTNTLGFFETIISATRDGDYKKFQSVGDDSFKEGISQEVFQAVSAELAPRLRLGYTATYLAHFRQEGSQVSLWKLSFLDGSDDRLMRLSVADCKVNGVLITPAFC